MAEQFTHEIRIDKEGNAVLLVIETCSISSPAVSGQSDTVSITVATALFS
jgi:hypothetical protein